MIPADHPDRDRDELVEAAYRCRECDAPWIVFAVEGEPTDGVLGSSAVQILWGGRCSEDSLMGRPRTCNCGICEKCKNRIRMAKTYAAMSPEERRDMMKRRNLEKRRERDRRSYWQNPEKYRAKARQQHRKHRNKDNARSAVLRAIRRGDLVRKPCEVCGSELRVEGHHDNYDKPLEVRWLCREHHMEEHQTLGVAA